MGLEHTAAVHTVAVAAVVDDDDVVHRSECAPNKLPLQVWHKALRQQQ
jgi:hypothetical protein